MSRSTRQRLSRSILLAPTLALVLLGLGGWAGPAGSQAAGDGDGQLGTPDHRSAPLLTPGHYTDTIKTGEINWYAVLYTNDTPYEFAADLSDVDLDSSDVLSLEVAFVGPTLGSVERGRSLEGGARYGGGGTNRWYLAVKLDTTGRLGEVHELELDVAGVASSGLEPCDTDPDCTLDDDLADLDTELTELQLSLDELPGEDPATVLQAEIAELERRKGEADTALGDATEAIAGLCAPEPDCEEVTDPGSSTPAWALAAGAIVLLSGLGFAAVSLRR